LVDDGNFALSTEEVVQFSRPSIDVLFESAAQARGSDVIGVILTGANEDGAAGLSAIARGGGTTIVQDPATAERSEMPEAAIAATEVDDVLDLDEIPSRLVSLVGVKS
jgi:two-component system, chemotaxis family, protein-glutamate methylesterase/glutaminase